MNKAFKLFLESLIERNYISVFNDENGSEYTIPAPAISGFLLNPNKSDDVGALDDGDFFLTCEYFIDGNVPSGLYTLKYGDLILESAKAPVLSHTMDQTARDLISLARMCSKKIITQQKMAQKRNMIMGMISNCEQHIN